MLLEAKNTKVIGKVAKVVRQQQKLQELTGNE